MDLISNAVSDGNPAVTRDMTLFERLIDRTKNRLVRLRQKLPYIVWYNDELDVKVTLSQDKLIPSDDQNESLKQLFSGAFYDAEKNFHEMGIGFDTGMGPNGRDWEWDWSLKGPISVRFRGRASKPEIRMEKPRPKLIVNNVSG